MTDLAEQIWNEGASSATKGILKIHNEKMGRSIRKDDSSMNSSTSDFG
jgi:hypothetical protein